MPGNEDKSSQSSSEKADRVSYNSKAVLLGLFVLVGFILLVFTISIRVVSTDVIDRLNTVFVAAVSGSLALGGTLITQLWGRSTKPTANSPHVYDTSPKHAQEGVSINSPITATFDKIVDSSTINSKTYILKDNSTNSNVAGTVTLNGGNSANFQPLTALKPSTKYTATITKEAKDIAGNSLATDKTWSFTTGQ